MMQAAHHRFRVDRTELRRLDESRLRAILLEPKMSTRPVIVREVLPKNPVLSENSIALQRSQLPIPTKESIALIIV
jgi:hypothetical protein